MKYPQETAAPSSVHFLCFLYVQLSFFSFFYNVFSQCVFVKVSPWNILRPFPRVGKTQTKVYGPKKGRTVSDQISDQLSSWFGISVFLWVCVYVCVCQTHGRHYMTRWYQIVFHSSPPPPLLAPLSPFSSDVTFTVAGGDRDGRGGRLAGQTRLRAGRVPQSVHGAVLVRQRANRTAWQNLLLEPEDRRRKEAEMCVKNVALTQSYHCFFIWFYSDQWYLF